MAIQILFLNARAFSVLWKTNFILLKINFWPFVLKNVTFQFKYFFPLHSPEQVHTQSSTFILTHNMISLTSSLGGHRCFAFQVFQSHWVLYIIAEI